MRHTHIIYERIFIYLFYDGQAVACGDCRNILHSQSLAFVSVLLGKKLLSNIDWKHKCIIIIEVLFSRQICDRCAKNIRYCRNAMLHSMRRDDVHCIHTSHIVCHRSSWRFNRFCCWYHSSESFPHHNNKWVECCFSHLYVQALFFTTTCIYNIGTYLPIDRCLILSSRGAYTMWFVNKM